MGDGGGRRAAVFFCADMPCYPEARTLVTVCRRDGVHGVFGLRMQGRVKCLPCAAEVISIAVSFLFLPPLVLLVLPWLPLVISFGIFSCTGPRNQKSVPFRLR